jgi:hypothetical protein
MSVDCLDLMILDSKEPNSAIVYARRKGDVVIEEIPIGSKLGALEAFRDRIRAALEPGPDARPTADELATFGKALFDFCFVPQTELRDLYPKSASEHVRIQMISNRADVRSIPWEFMQDSQDNSGPRRRRSIVRIVPNLSLGWKKRKRGSKLKILIAASYPLDQTRVPWAAVRDEIETSLSPYAAAVELKTLAPADWNDFGKELDNYKPDVVHFVGHGTIASGETQLFFMNKTTDASQVVDAESLGVMLQDRDIRVVVLTACDTSSVPVNFTRKASVSVASEVLVRRGLRAVIASQLPMPSATAASFVGPLYRTLLGSGDIDEAVAAGRVELFTNLNNSSNHAKLEWGIPTLHRHLYGLRPFEAS